jgi:hypothetical protein
MGDSQILEQYGMGVYPTSNRKTQARRKGKRSVYQRHPNAGQETQKRNIATLPPNFPAAGHFRYHFHAPLTPGGGCANISSSRPTNPGRNFHTYPTRVILLCYQTEKSSVVPVSGLHREPAYVKTLLLCQVRAACILIPDTWNSRSQSKLVYGYH